MTAFDLFDAPIASPVVVEVPHSGLDVPPRFGEPLIATDDQRRRDADLFVDRIWTEAPRLGVPLLVARLSRYVCDLNRDPEDVDEEVVVGVDGARPTGPRGFVWRLTTDGAPAHSRPLSGDEWKSRRDDVWAPYHECLAWLLEAARARHGFAVLLSAHSMPSIGRAAHGDAGRKRADVVVGVRGGTSCSSAIRDLVSGHFSSRGYSVAIDDPYRGGATTERYGRPEASLHAVQIEMARALYMDEERLSIRDDGLARLRADSAALLGALAAVGLP